MPSTRNPRRIAAMILLSIGALLVAAPQASATSDRAAPQQAAAEGGEFVSVPDEYVYDPSLGTQHDYCSYSPDEFPNPVGDNADFRGPCARHDLCYGDPSRDQLDCDNELLADMHTNCEYEYAWYDPTLYACEETAWVYWGFVVGT